MNEYSTVRMPFGKWKGEQLRNIPCSYMSWALENFDRVKFSEIREAIESEMEERLETGVRVTDEQERESVI